MNGYLCFYKGKRFECYADSSYAAKVMACAHFKVHPKRGYAVSVMLAEKDGVCVVHSAAFV